MKLFILLTGIFEILVGIVMFTKPELIPQFDGASAIAIATARMYGAAAISMGTFAVMVAQNFNRTEWHQLFLTVYLVFHTTVGAAILIAATTGGDPSTGILHIILAAATGYFLYQIRAKSA